MEEVLKELYKKILELEKEIKFIDLLDEKSDSGGFVIKQLIFKMDLNVKIKMYKEHHKETRYPIARICNPCSQTK